MTGNKPETTFVVPPPGPLVWLYPELARASSRPGGPAAHDLCRSGYSAAQLIDSLAGRRAERIIIEDGPRGHSLWSRLSHFSRTTGIDVRQPSLSPPPLAEHNLSWPLESLLTAAGERAGEGEAVIVERFSEAAIQFKAVSLTALPQDSQLLARLDNSTTLALLPLRPGDGLERQVEYTLDVVSRDIVSFRHAGIVPYFVTGSFTNDLQVDSQRDGGRLNDGHPVETRLLPSWWGVLPGDSYPRPLRELYRNLVRLLYPDRMFLFLAFENYALAGIDLYGESLMDRFMTETHPPSAPISGSTSAAELPDISSRRGRDHQPLVIGVCGIDGSGKSSHVAALEQYLIGRGLRTSVQKIYRHGVFHDTVTELTRQCAGDCNLHLWRIQRIAKAFDSIKYFYAVVEGDLASCDAVIFDRYVFTHYAAGIGRYHHDPFTRELLAVFPPADRIYLLDVPSEEALRRIGTRDEKTVDENPYMLSRYRHALLDLGQRHGFLVLDGRKSFAENSRIILEDTARLVESKNGTS